MADERDPREHGYMPALWMPGGQHFLTPDGHRVVTLEQALAEIAERETAA